MIAWMLSAALAAPPADVLPHRTTAPSEYLHAELRPLGFSPDGHFAALYMPPDEAIGCFLWELRITNLVTDEVTVPLYWDESSCAETPDAASLWKNHGAAIRAQLRAHGIQQPASPLRLAPFPSRGGEVLSAWVRPGVPEVSGDESRFSVPVEIWLRSGKKEKKIGTRTLSAEYGLPMAWNQEIVGYIQSPHEDRLAVLVREERRGWEGPPNVEVITVMGASLSSGF